MTTQTSPADNERLAHLEGTVEQVVERLSSIDSQLGGLRAEMTAGDEALRARMTAGDEALRAQMTAGFEALRAEMTAGDGSLRAEMTAGFEALRAEMTAGDGSLRAEMTAGFEALREELRSQRNMFVTAFAITWASILAGFIAIFAAILNT